MTLPGTVLSKKNAIKAPVKFAFPKNILMKLSRVILSASDIIIFLSKKYQRSVKPHFMCKSNSPSTKFKMAKKVLKRNKLSGSFVQSHDDTLVFFRN